jgi:GNAT superfamily N-acetyltransferase
VDDRSIEFRSARPSDLDQIVELLLVQLHEHGIPITPESLRGAVAAWLEDGRRGLIMVAAREPLLVGVACVDFMWPLEHGGLGGWLEELYVRPECRGSGVGSKLLEATLEACARLGCRALDLEVESDHGRVEALYRRFGFTPLFSRRRWVRRLQI